MKKILLTLCMLLTSFAVFGQTYSKELEKAAKKGDVVAQRNLGLCYLKGNGIKCDYKKAYKWFEKAAANEDGGAQYYIGYMLENGLPLKKEKKNNLFGQVALGIITGGRSISANKTTRGGLWTSSQSNDLGRPSEWYEKAAINGWLEAQYKMAEISNEPLKWYKMAATSGDAEAQYKYACALLEIEKTKATNSRRNIITYSGTLITPDIKYYSEYVKHPQKLGMGNNGRPMSEIEWRTAVYNRYGDFPIDLPPVNADFEDSNENTVAESTQWFKKAAAQGHKGAQAYLQQLEEQAKAEERRAQEQQNKLRKYRTIKLEKPNSILSALPLDVLKTIDSLTIVGFMYETDLVALQECKNLRYLNLSKSYVTYSPAKKSEIEARQQTLSFLFGLLGSVADEKYNNYEMDDLEHAYAKGFSKLISENIVTKAEEGCLIPADVLQELKNLETVILPLRASSIGENAFKQCDKLKNVKLPPYLVSIGNSAFSGCYNLSSISFPSTLKELGDGSFALTKIGVFDLSGSNFNFKVWKHNFTGCRITKLLLPKGVSQFEIRCSELQKGAQVYVPDGVVRFDICYRYEAHPKFHFRSQTPPRQTISVHMFDGDRWGLEGSTIYIPKGCTTEYYAKYGNSITYIEE